jgi:hypothetical protein
MSARSKARGTCIRAWVALVHENEGAQGRHRDSRNGTERNATMKKHSVVFEYGWRKAVGFACALLALSACAAEVSSEEALVEDDALGLKGGNAGGGTTATGNGAPSGGHYQLNIIGVPKGKTADLTGSSGRRIFVPLDGSTKILLNEGEFAVLDANGTDGSASFQLPNPDPENDGVTEYSVYARALGTPGGSSTTTTCATDPVTGELYCSVESMVLVRESGGSKFSNVSRQLLYVYADIDGDGDIDRVPLFGDELEDYYWQYDNAGLKLAQLRFYPIATDVNDAAQ